MIRIFKSICYWYVYDVITVRRRPRFEQRLEKLRKPPRQTNWRGVRISVQTPVAIVLVLRTAKARKNKIQCKTNK